MKLPLSGAIGKMRIRKGSFFYLLILLLCNCREESYNSPTIKIDKSIKSFAFDKNSYWIYKDSASNRLDSMYVDEVKNWIQFVKFGSFQNYLMTFHTFFGNGRTGFVFEGSNIWFDNGTTSHYRLLFTTIPYPDTVTNWHNRNRGMIGEISINGNNYSSVWISELDSAQRVISGTYERFYFKDSVGIIRYQSFKNNKCLIQKDLTRYFITFNPLK